ncbi:MAG: hypothetical protein A2504_10550 [Bdellovibrionales bacterium RIFOXYD12_FULL_39_22]|nr:MAG: hypothetical protein A2385_14185 [Bdellovibrionales bacterium RIFOXYB1_FULL_39_21]OFZ40384.1 MAG: hypothetical protein A2485_02875 [Bdellovibrionales bacterium RIFOXYC12_FULL_39_17]OFZ49633.1 MAG: hypothetical protein A2404_09335 [Bdellovibrionales bacterium RIFOXYC1_FULL_39_130]OFZ77303.1 MAG: hypothetical protein A2560_06000 [Bdellovibrionales bacterium RIFOXYD1_FULL_39_84]OFZ95958.1 MAG: hypothetical protein A2504_10550 [Bdellovibrionales bacterium RIFOXYD12_FULL_39_22]HLE11219.1 GN
MALVMDRAKVEDVDKLLSLYLLIYQDDYPLEIGTNRQVMKEAIENKLEFLWLVMRDDESNAIAGSCIFEMDLKYKIGKVVGVAVADNYRDRKIATTLIEYGTRRILEEQKLVHSLYATTRTLAIHSQRMFLSNGFFPLGIFPNARKIKSYETLTLMAKFKKDLFERRAHVEEVPEIISPMLSIMSEIAGIKFHTRAAKSKCATRSIGAEQESPHGDLGGFEFIYAPFFVQRRFNEVFKNDDDSHFYPFHTPNMLITCNDGTPMNLYATFNKKDHYCVIVTGSKTASVLGKARFKKLIFAMKEMGIYYVETLVRLSSFDTIDFLTQNGFLPSAFYPAMREINGELHDYILLTRTMVPLDFNGMAIDHSFMPFIKQYTQQWIKMNLKSFDVFWN